MNWGALARRPQSVPEDLFRIALGCALIALGFRLFLNANQIVVGGLVGLSTILERALGWEPAWIQWSVNIPLLLLSFRALGKGDGLRSVFGALLLPLCVLLARPLAPLTHTPLLATIFGGLIYGAGVGLVLSGSGSVGGFSLLIRLASRTVPLSPGTALFLLDALTILCGWALFGPEKAMYGLIASFVMRRALDSMLVGFARAQMALVISSEHAAIRAAILKEMDRGLTVVPATGGFTGDERPVLMVVLSQAEVPRLRAVVRQRDPQAFVVLTDVAQVLGNGFRGAG